MLRRHSSARLGLRARGAHQATAPSKEPLRPKQPTTPTRSPSGQEGGDSMQSAAAATSPSQASVMRRSRSEDQFTSGMHMPTTSSSMSGRSASGGVGADGVAVPRPVSRPTSIEGDRGGSEAARPMSRPASSRQLKDDEVHQGLAGDTLANIQQPNHFCEIL
jgi:hypothetical protein